MLTIYLGPNAPGERPAKPVRSSRQLDVPSVASHALSCIVMIPTSSPKSRRLQPVSCLPSGMSLKR